LNESFTLSELDAAARLGVTHLQLDDGWQAGRSGNSAFAGGTFDGIWDRKDFWAVHPEKFPNGLRPIVDHANRHRLQLGLWYNPSKDNDYANWRQDAEQIVRLHRTHGVALFKIDGVDIATKRAERNLGRMLEHACTATQGAIRFNLDVTAGRRFGYFVLNEYGNKFLENRYTDFRNYYPHWTLRNLWQLARYVPLQGIQAEFLNVWRNPHLYPAADPLAPANVGFAYAFACTMAAQPLAWMEASQLPEAADAVMPLIRQYRAIQSEWHQGRIMPIGEEPDGLSWTGFQSCNSAGRGYVLVFREYSDRASTSLRLWECPTEPIRFTHILGSGEDFIAATDKQGCIAFELPQRMSFAVYRYERITDRAEIRR
ncbi:MAG: alpha-galactosidase, partial [Tepidisphaeraceae bacterium]